MFKICLECGVEDIRYNSAGLDVSRPLPAPDSALQASGYHDVGLAQHFSKKLIWKS